MHIMRNLSTYIEYTLMTRHYAFVPGIGGFLLRDVDASYVHGKYTPSHREVHFNRFLTNDDGMLADAYMSCEGITYDEAISQIRIEVAAIKSAIERKKSFELGNLGILSYDSDHHLVVKNPKHFPIDPDCYGLEAISIRPWAEMEGKRYADVNVSKHTADVVSIPKYWLQRAVAVAVLVICVFANIMFFQNNNAPKTNNATMFDTEILFGNAEPNIKADSIWNKEVAISNQAESCAPVAETVAETGNAKLSENTNKKTNEYEVPVQRSVVQASPTSGKLFFIIIASCSNFDDAERAARKKVAEGYEDVGILEKDGRYRLYLKSFAVRAEGESYLDEVRVSTPFQSAWLLPVRQESLLSYNQKNNDNDQLPMELSHHYKRTERDQGWINT